MTKLAVIEPNIFNEHADTLECKRADAREARRITYDCLNARVYYQKTFCKLGHKFLQSKDGSMSTLACLKGASSSVCQKCKDFKEEDMN